MGTKSLLGVLVLLLAFTVPAQQTRLVIGDSGLTVVEKTYERELAPSDGGALLRLDVLPPQTLPESVSLREAGESPRLKILSQTLHRDTSERYQNRDMQNRPIHPAWRIEVPGAGKYTLTLHYLVRNLQWDGVYNLFLSPDMSTMRLQAAIAIQNMTEEQYRQPEIVLARRSGLTPPIPMSFSPYDRNVSLYEGFKDRELLSLEAVPVLEAAATTNIPLEDTPSLKIAPFLQYNEDSRDRNERIYSAEPVPSTSGTWWCVELPNTPENGLGISLPKGSVRIFQELAEGAILRSSGTVQDTPPGKPLQVNLTPEPGITVNRQVERPGDMTSSRSAQRLTLYKVILSSTLDRMHEVRVFMRPGPRQEPLIAEASDLYKTHDDGLIEFRVEVEPGTEKVISYKAAQ